MMNQLKFGRFAPLDYARQEAVNTLCTNLSFSGEKFKKIIDMYVSHGLGREANGRFFLTPEGMLISNSIIIQLINALD